MQLIVGKAPTIANPGDPLGATPVFRRGDIDVLKQEFIMKGEI
jgi:hypothetical protein